MTSRKQAQVATRVDEYLDRVGRKSNTNGDSNDRKVDRKIARKLRRMKPEDLDALIRAVDDPDDGPPKVT